MQAERGKRSTALRTLFRNGVLLTASLVTCALLLEIASRIVYAQRLDYQIEMSRYAALMKRRPSGNPLLSHHHAPGTNAVLMGVPVSINSHGFRDGEYPLEKAPGVFRILLLGDSLTFGWGAKAQDRFSNRLEASLDRAHDSGRRVQVVNTGIGNYNTAQEVAFYEERGRAFKPDLVILNYFINDAEPTPHRRDNPLFKYSYLGMWLWGRIDTIGRLYFGKETFGSYYANLYRDEAPGWVEAQSAIGRLVRMTAEDDTKLVVVLLPELHAVGAQYGFQSIHDLVARVASREGAPTADLAPCFKAEAPETLWVSPDDAHPNARAHAIIGNCLEAYLTEKALIP